MACKESRRIRVGIDSYSLDPMRMSPFAILDWVKDNGGDGVQFTGIPRANVPGGRDVDSGLARELGEHARRLGLYIEWGGARHIPINPKTGERVDIASIILASAELASAAGTSVIRSCSGGLMRWDPYSIPTEHLLMAMVSELRPLIPRLADLGVSLAIETHFEFTTFELVRVFEACGAEPGGPIGICLDTMNLMTMLEHPTMAMDRVLPWVVATHAKDGCIVPHEKGFEVFTTEAGKGQIDWPAVMKRLRGLSVEVNLSIEDHGGSFVIPYYDPLFFSRFPDVSAQELAALHRMAAEGVRRVQAGELTVVPRPDWPQLCQTRVAAGIAGLKAIERMTRGDAKGA